jgi:hypothetical protein
MRKLFHHFAARKQVYKLHEHFSLWFSALLIPLFQITSKFPHFLLDSELPYQLVHTLTQRFVFRFEVSDFVVFKGGH